MTAIHRLTQANYGVHFADQTALVATPLIAALAFGSGPETIGLLVAAQSSAHLLGSIPFGILVDQKQPKTLAILATLILALGCVLAALSTAGGSATLFGVGITLAGFGTVLFGLTTLSILPKVVVPETLARANAAIQLPRALCSFAVPLLVGVLATRVPAAAILALAGGCGSLRHAERRDVSKVQGRCEARCLGRDPHSRRWPLRVPPSPPAADHFMLDIVESVLCRPSCGSCSRDPACFPLRSRRLRYRPFRFWSCRDLGLMALGSGRRHGQAICHPPFWTGQFRLGCRWSALDRSRDITDLPPCLLFSGSGSAPRCGSWPRTPCASLFHPPELLGRVNAVIQTAIYGVRPLGALLGGIVAGAYGPVAWIVACCHRLRPILRGIGVQRSSPDRQLQRAKACSLAWLCRPGRVKGQCEAQSCPNVQFRPVLQKAVGIGWQAGGRSFVERKHLIFIQH